MKWFKHESAAGDSPRLRRLRSRYGVQGYGLYWFLVEQIGIGWEVHGVDLNPSLEVEDIEDALRIPSGQVPDMIRWMIEKGLFEASATGLLKCESLRNHVGEAQRKAERRERPKPNSGQAPDSVRIVSGQTPEKEEIRGEEIRVEPPLPPLSGGCVRGDSDAPASLFPGEESLSPEKKAPKKKRAVLTEKPDPFGWSDFARVYPAYRLKPDVAAKAWFRRNITDDEDGRSRLALILGNVMQWLKSEQWIQGKVPNCSKFLDERIWEGEPGPPPYRSVQERQEGNREAMAGAKRILGFDQKGFDDAEF